MMRRVFFLSVLMVLVLTSQTFAMINDLFATEVLLNKPGITHNLDFMKYADSVTVRGDTVIYRSNSGGNAAVILKKTEPAEGIGGLSVRIQMPVMQQVMPYLWSTVEIRNAEIDDFGKGFLESLGYEVNFVGIRTVSIEPGIDPGTGIDAPDGIPAVETRDVQRVLLSKGDVRWSIIQHDNEAGKGVDFMLHIEGTETMSDEVRGDLKQMLAFYGFGEDVLNQLDANLSMARIAHMIQHPNMAADEFDFQSAMKTELEWLKANGVIMGITAQDIAEISSFSRRGIAGLHLRIVHSEGKWVPYCETVDDSPIAPDEYAQILKGELPYFSSILEGAAADTTELVIPDDMPSFPATSVNPNSKAIAKWGEVKNCL